MAQITLKGNPINTNANLPAIGTEAPQFSLVKTDLSPASLEDFKGKKVVLNIFPSLDTSVCATSVREFNSKVSSLDNTVVLCISKDLPFAQARFCGAEGLDNVIPLSDFRNADFAEQYGIKITDGPLSGLDARAVVVLDEKGSVKYTELVPEIVEEPNYEAAIAAL